MSEMIYVMILWELKIRLLSNVVQRCLQSTTTLFMLCTETDGIPTVTILTNFYLGEERELKRLRALAALAESLGSIPNIDS